MPAGHGSSPERAIQLELAALPAAVAAVMARLAEHGHEAALVGGCVRDLLRGLAPDDWDVATSAPPEAVAALFPRAAWENAFGTVTIRTEEEPPTVQVTTYRIEGSYRDRRRPDEVRWGDSLREDLARRDFTINAMAWVPTDLAMRSGTLEDPFDGRMDLEAGVLRAVGDPEARVAEDALRLIRATRFATRFGLRLDPATEAAIARNAAAARELSGERVRDELLRILGEANAAEPPSAAFRLMERLLLLEVILPELAALRGVPQEKPLHGDALDHSLRTADALSPGDPILRLVGLLHDVGKATTLAEGHFIGHEVVGSELVETVLRRLRLPRTEIARARHLVRQHMFVYRDDWTDAAVRRFVRRVGPDALPDLFALRAADNAASGTAEPARGGLRELQERVAAELARTALTVRQLEIGGDDLVRGLAIEPGPMVGQLLARLLEAVIEDPARNERGTLLELARSWQAKSESRGREQPRT